jgi:hypothetical protein
MDVSLITFSTLKQRGDIPNEISMFECDKLLILYYLEILNKHKVVETDTPTVTDKGARLAKVLSDSKYSIRPDSMIKVILLLFGDKMDREDAMALCMMIEILQTEGIDSLLESLDNEDED